MNLMGSRHRRASIASLLTLLVSVNAIGQDDLTELSLEELMNVEVTSVSKKAEKRSEAAAAVHVLSSDDIIRSGAATIPDALRLVPGVNVAKLDSNKWSVSVRGFTGRFSNKLLVLIDGRTIYTSLFSGVYWELVDLPIEDVERIEVIRGPGGTVWGANAVNGVINIVTKNAADTQGGIISAGGGTEREAFSTLRYGGSLNEDAYYRVYLKGTVWDSQDLASGDKGNDAWRNISGGFRLDWPVTDEDALLVEGGIIANNLKEEIVLPFLRPPYTRTLANELHQTTGYALTRWTRTMSDASSLQLQLYYERWQTNDPKTVDEQRDTIDLDFQHRFEANHIHDIVWGVGYRYISGTLPGTKFLSFDPKDRDTHLVSAFIQDEITLIEDELTLIIGTKVEHNDHTGIELQPSARIGWTPAENQYLWASVSRAVRTPSRSEDDVRIANMSFPGALVALLGDRGFDSETLWAFEAGYRIQPRENLAFDLALFYNMYEDLRTVEIRRPYLELYPFPPHLLIPVVADNNMDANTYGFELAADWKPKPWWRVRGGYTFLEVDTDLHPKTIDILSASLDGDAPQQQLFMTNHFDLPGNVSLDVIMRYVDALPSLGVDDYLTSDVRLAWQATEDLSFELVGQNLFDSQHLEYTSSFVNTVPTEVERGVYAKLTWRF